MKRIYLVLIFLLLPVFSFSATTVEYGYCGSGNLFCVDTSGWTNGGSGSAGCDLLQDSQTAWIGGSVYFLGTGTPATAGACPPEGPTEPDHCTNDVKDGDETGVDCGGSCQDCITVCPDGMDLVPLYGDGQTTYVCMRTAPKNEAGDCPPGYTLPLDGDRCADVSPTVAPADVSPDDVHPDNNDPAIPPSDPDPWTSNDETTTVDQDRSTVTNPDNSTTETVTTTTTDKDSTTTETEVIHRDPNGNETGRDTTIIVEGQEPFDDGDIVAAINNVRRQVASDLGEANTTLTNIDNNTKDLMTDTGTAEADAMSEIDTAISTALNTDQENDTFQADILANAGDGQTFPVSESITASVKSAFPSPQSCTVGYVMQIQGREFKIDCQYFDMTRVLLQWIFGILTLFSLYQIVFRPIGGT